MNSSLVVAAILAVLVGAVHSAMGELVIFAKLRQGGVVPTLGGGVIPSRQLRILWASWHLLTLFGWAIAAVLWLLAAEPSGGSLRASILYTVAGGMLSGAVVVGGATRGRHLGWLGLLGVAVLTAWGASH